MNTICLVPHKLFKKFSVLYAVPKVYMRQHHRKAITQ